MFLAVAKLESAPRRGHRLFGLAKSWEGIEMEGAPMRAIETYKKDGRTLAVVTIFRNLQSLHAAAPWKIKYARKTRG